MNVKRTDLTPEAVARVKKHYAKFGMRIYVSAAYDPEFDLGCMADADGMIEFDVAPTQEEVLTDGRSRTLVNWRLSRSNMASLVLERLRKAA